MSYSIYRSRPRSIPISSFVFSVPVPISYQCCSPPLILQLVHWKTLKCSRLLSPAAGKSRFFVLFTFLFLREVSKNYSMDLHWLTRKHCNLAFEPYGSILFALLTCIVENFVYRGTTLLQCSVCLTIIGLIYLNALLSRNVEFVR